MANGGDSPRCMLCNGRVCEGSKRFSMQMGMGVFDQRGKQSKDWGSRMRAPPSPLTRRRVSQNRRRLLGSCAPGESAPCGGAVMLGGCRGRPEGD
jgi:hypothetical protein